MTTIVLLNETLAADRNHASFLNEVRFDQTKIGRSKYGTVALAKYGSSASAEELGQMATELELVLAFYDVKEGLPFRKRFEKKHEHNHLVAMQHTEDGCKAIEFKGSMEFPFFHEGILQGTGDLIARTVSYRQSIKNEFDIHEIMTEVGKRDMQSSTEYDVVYCHELEIMDEGFIERVGKEELLATAKELF